MNYNQMFTILKIFQKLSFNNLQSEYPVPRNIIVIEINDITQKTKLVVRPGFIATRFDEKSFFSTILGFTPHWGYKHYKKYTSQKNVFLSSINKIHLKCDCINGSFLDGCRQQIFLISF